MKKIQILKTWSYDKGLFRISFSNYYTSLLLCCRCSNLNGFLASCGFKFYYYALKMMHILIRGLDWTALESSCGSPIQCVVDLVAAPSQHNQSVQHKSTNFHIHKWPTNATHITSAHLQILLGIGGTVHGDTFNLPNLMTDDTEESAYPTRQMV